MIRLERVTPNAWISTCQIHNVLVNIAQLQNPPSQLVSFFLALSILRSAVTPTHITFREARRLTTIFRSDLASFFTVSTCQQPLHSNQRHYTRTIPPKISTMVHPLVSMSVAGAAMLLLIDRALGHMIMRTPAPYNLDTPPLLQVDPISGGHFPFPCHNQYGITSRTPVEAGSATLVNFTGGGQHGGGSCQFSISWDEPINGGNWNKSAVFKTIYSITGGCPAVFTNETLNLAPAAVDQDRRQDSKHCGNDTGIDCIRQFMVPVPRL